MQPTHDLELIGSHPDIEQARRLLPLIANADSSVLIVGEPGTGRGHLARLVHQRSRRRRGPFAVVACPGCADADEFDELFGGEGRAGLLETHADGTIYLADVDELPAVLQGRLARFADGAALGEVARAPRLIASSGRSLERLVARGRFRSDLYYRLSVVTIRLPPLRERREDIAPLAAHFLRRSTGALGKALLRGISGAALEALERHRWRGNLAELAAAIHRAAVVESGAVLGADSLPPALLGAEALSAA